MASWSMQWSFHHIATSVSWPPLHCDKVQSSQWPASPFTFGVPVISLTSTILPTYLFYFSPVILAFLFLLEPATSKPASRPVYLLFPLPAYSPRCLQSLLYYLLGSLLKSSQWGFLWPSYLKLYLSSETSCLFPSILFKAIIVILYLFISLLIDFLTSTTRM